MNVWQVSRQIAYKLGQKTWPDGNAEVVFGQAGTYVTAGIAEDAIGRVRLPAVIITPIDEEADEHSPEIITQGFELTLIATSTSDHTGENVLIGGPRSAGQGSSKGRGILELAEETLKAVGSIGSDSGINLYVLHASGVEAEFVDGLGFVATKTISLRSTIGRERFYHVPLRLTATNVGSGTGQTALAWTLPPDRFDRQDLVLRRAAGATAPTSSTSGTGVTLSDPDADTSHTDTPGAGQFSYSLFMGYDENGDGSNERFSSAATVTVTVV